jgi:hypothetical protein
MHFAAGLLALILALLASSPGAGARIAKSHDPALADDPGVLAPCDAADVDDDDSSPGGEPPESGNWALCAQGPQLGLDPSGRVDLARSYTGLSPARHLRRGGNSPPGCPP